MLAECGLEWLKRARESSGVLGGDGARKDGRTGQNAQATVQDEREDDDLADSIIRVRDEDSGDKGDVDRDGAEDSGDEKGARAFASLDVEEEGDTEEDPNGADDGRASLDIFTRESLNDGDTVVCVSASEVSKEDA